MRSARAIKPRAGDATQHPGETAAALDVLPRLLLLLDARTSRPIAALLRIGYARRGDDARRKAGEDEAPHRYRPDTLRHASY
jgi:hypothetical protein